jgi:hypothetical protein
MWFSEFSEFSDGPTILPFLQGSDVPCCMFASFSYSLVSAIPQMANHGGSSPMQRPKNPENLPTESLSEPAAPSSHLAFVHATAALIKNFLAP